MTASSEEIAIEADSPGRRLALRVHRFGRPGARPKVYCQAGLHADEMPGPLILHHLMALLGQGVVGEIVVVPLANPGGFAQWLNHKPQGRNDLGTGGNFNRGFADLTAIRPALTDDPAANRPLIRAAMLQALEATPAPDEAAFLKRQLLILSHDADVALDLHCDHFAVPHLYASPTRPDLTDLLSSCMGAELALIAQTSGGHAFDEALSAPWAALGQPLGCYSATLEYRGQFDVSDALAQQDAANLMTFLAAIGAVDGPSIPAHAPAPQRPLAAALEAFAPQGGIVTWNQRPGAEVTKGQPIAHITDPTTGLRLPVPAPCDGLLFRQELWRHCLRGQSLGHVAGHLPLRQGDLLSN